MSNTLGDRVRAPTWEPGPFGWSQQRVDGAEVICLAGELDLAVADDLRSRLMRTAESSAAAVIVLDLSDVVFIDASCAGVIMGAWESAKRHGGQLEVAGLHGIPELVFNLLGLAPILVRRTDISNGGRDPGDRLARRRYA